MNGVVNFLFHDINLKLVGATKHAMENGIAMRVRRGPIWLQTELRRQHPGGPAHLYDDMELKAVASE